MFIFICIFTLINAQNASYDYISDDAKNLASQMGDYHRSELNAIYWLDDNERYRYEKIKDDTNYIKNDLSSFNKRLDIVEDDLKKIERYGSDTLFCAKEIDFLIYMFSIIIIILIICPCSCLSMIIFNSVIIVLIRKYNKGNASVN